jgi:NAD+ kinase
LKVNLVVNTYRDDAVETAAETAVWLAGRGIEVGIDAESSRRVPLNIIESRSFGLADLVVAFGGDGTLIRAVHLCADRGTPILGVYFGRFGFVTQGTKEGLIGSLEEFIAGKGSFEKRMMLDVELLRGGHTVAHVSALNETVLQRAVVARMMTFKIKVDGRVLTSYPADGVIVSTPTGSTAYNLSAGGPILDPNISALVLTAIAPHTLNSRTLVLGADSEILLEVESRGDAVLSADGQTRLHLLSGDVVRVKRSTRVTNLVSVEKDDFLMKLGQRLLWSQSLLGVTE